MERWSNPAKGNNLEKVGTIRNEKNAAESD